MSMNTWNLHETQIQWQREKVSRNLNKFNKWSELFMSVHYAVKFYVSTLSTCMQTPLMLLNQRHRSGPLGFIPVIYSKSINLKKQ